MPSEFRLGFTSLEEEVAIDRLPVKGSIPAWLRGTLIRNGPAKFEVGERSLRHWFDGLAMLHKFSFKEKEVCYANKFIRSNAFNKAMATGRIAYREFATDPCRSIFARAASFFSPRMTDNTNVNLTRLANKFIAMTETPLPVEFNPQTLETVGVSQMGKQTGQITTAHPHYDYTSREMINYITHFSRKSKYSIYRTPSDTMQRILVGSVPVDEPGYMHSFAVTENYVILVEYPILVKPLSLLLSGRPFIENFGWKPQRGTRFIVVDKGNGKVVGTCTASPFFAFHNVNAFEIGDDIAIDIIAYPNPNIIRELYLDVLNGEVPTVISAGNLRRYMLHLPIREGEVEYQSLAKEPLELPRIDYEHRNTRKYDFVYGISTYTPDEFASQLVKVDIENGSKIWHEDNTYPGEPVFVPRPKSTEEDDGVVLSVLLDAKKGNSFLLILSARSFEELGRVEVPHHIPIGLHGQYFHDVT